MIRRVHKNDPVFGTMLYMGDKLHYWEAKTTFAPTGNAIEVFVDGLSDGSLDTQHAFFATIQERWAELAAGIRHLLKVEYPDLPPIALSSLSIPDCASFDEAVWEISFSHSSSGELYTVEMRGEKPRRVSRDR